MRAGRARAAAAVLAFFVLPLSLAGCTGEDAELFLGTIGEIYTATSSKLVTISSDAWYYKYRHEMSPDAWKGEAVLDLSVPGFTLQDLSSTALYDEPVVESAGSGRIRSVTAMLRGDGRVQPGGLFGAPVQEDLPGYGYDADYPGIVPGALFRQAPMLPDGGECRALATAYAWEAGLSHIFAGVRDYLAASPGNSLLWRLTAVYSSLDSMPCGFLAEWQGMDGSFSGCKYVYNVQPGIAFDYFTGRNWVEAAGDPEPPDEDSDGSGEGS